MTIALENVTVSFDGRDILKDFSLELSTDGAYLVTGDRSAGKTTLLRVIMGLQKPDKGMIRLLGDYKYSWLACGAVFQEDRLIGSLSAVRNISVIRKLTSDKAAREELLELLPADRLEEPVDRLTASERRAVCIVRALSVPSDIIVMDEPFSGMEDGERARALKYVLDHRGSTPLVIASTERTGMESFKTVLIRGNDNHGDS